MLPNLISLDDYGEANFCKEIKRQSWTDNSGKHHKAVFEPYNHGYGADENKTFIYIKNLRDWRRIEKLYFKTHETISECFKQHYDYADKLFREMKKSYGTGAKGYFLKRSYNSTFFIHVSKDYNNHDERPSISTYDIEKADAHDASIVWSWIDTPEQDEFNRLSARAEQSTKRNFIVQSSFHRALKFRLQDWCEQKFGNKYRYASEKRVVSVENEGRSYGFVVGCMGEIEETLWSPTRMMTSFK